MATTRSDNCSADIAAGVVIEPGRPQARLERTPQDQPDRNDHQHQDIGQRQIAGEEPGRRRQDHVSSASRLAALDPTTRRTNSTMNRNNQQHNGNRRSAGAVVVLDEGTDPLRRHFGFTQDRAADEHDRARTRRWPGERQTSAGEQCGQQCQQDHPGEDDGVGRASDAAASSGFPVQFEQHGLHRAHHEGQRDEQQRQPDTPLGVLQMQFHRTARPVERQHDQARHNGGQRERQVDHRRSTVCRRTDHVSAPRPPAARRTR